FATAHRRPESRRQPRVGWHVRGLRVKVCQAFRKRLMAIVAANGGQSNKKI
ncbi:Hypothetical protein FKW44_011062, partial [Caligus rogercresseyi]